MIRKAHIGFILMAISSVFIGCMRSEGNPPSNGAPRFIVSGTVTDTTGAAISGIRVSLNGFITTDGREIASYNYAITDTAGQYTIIRYRGRDILEEIEVSVADTAGIYQSQTLLAPVAYDKQWSESTHQQELFNGLVTADFILIPKE